MSATPNNVPSSIGLPSSAPSDVRSVALYLSQAVQALNQWIALVANALNRTVATAASSIQKITGSTHISVTQTGTEATIALSGTFFDTAGTGLTASGSTVSLAPTAVTAGSYTNTNLTVNAEGQITAASSGSSGGSGITQLTGDVTAGPGSGSQAATLATVNANVGTFQGLTLNAKGLVTAAANQGYLTGNQTITLSGDVSGSGATAIAVTLDTVNSNVGTFQGLTVNAKGLVTAATNESYLTANQTITLSGDASGSGTTSVPVTLDTVNSNVGTFQGITVNGKGLVTAAAANAFVSTGGLNPTGTSSSGAMMGLGILITPKTSGNVFMQIEGSATVSSTATTVIQGRYGTGTAPSNGASPTGTAFANATWVPGAASLSNPVQVSAVISGLTLGTTYWIDLNLSTTAGTVSVGGCRVNAFEI